MARILHVVPSLNPMDGGPTEAIRQLAEATRELGHETTVACCDSPGARWLGDYGLDIAALGPSKGKYMHTKRLIPWLTRHGEDFDGVVINGLWQYSSYACWRAMKRIGRQYVIYPHGMLDPWFKHAYPLKHLKKALYWRAFEYRVLRDAASVLFTCEEELILARQSFRPYKVRELVANLGTSAPDGDPDLQRRAFFESVPELRDTRFLLFLSRIHPKKGCDLLLSAFADVKSSDPELKLVIAGPDQLGWRRELELQAQSLGVAGSILWPGMLSGDAKWGAFHACEAFVLPSHQENFGIVVAEALACSKPVLVSNKVNIWREIEASGAGLVAEDTVSGVRDSIRSWLSMSTSAKAAMGESAARCFQEHFDISRAGQNLARALGL